MSFRNSTLALRLLDLLIGSFWLFLLVDAYAQGNELPMLLDEVPLPAMPVVPVASGIAIFALGCAVVAYWQRRNIMEDMPILSDGVDRLFGEGAYTYFTGRLHPANTSALSSLVLGVVCIRATEQSIQSDWSYAVALGFIAFSLAMFVAILLSIRMPPILK